MKLKIFICYLFLMFFYYNVQADEIQLDNGDRITGKIINKTNDSLLVNTHFAGEISIKWSAVHSLKSESTITVQLQDGSLVIGQLIKSDTDALKLHQPGSEETSTIDLAEVKAINPVLEDPEKIEFRGTFNIGAYQTAGNTDNQSIHVDAEAIARQRDDRLKLGGVYNQVEDSGVESANNILAYGKLDHFINKKWYAYGNLTFERDEFQDLRLRSILGAGMGYQFWENENSNLSLEAGPSYVNEDYFTSEDKNFITARWALNYDRWFFNKVIQLFHYHEGIVPYEDTSNINIRSKTGFRIPLIEKFTITTELDLDYDNQPSPGNKKTDRKYLLNVGYQW